MKVKYAETFQKRFIEQLEFIAFDNKLAAIKFKNKVKDRLKNIAEMPYQCRKSIYFNDKNIRDLVVDGYTITYQVTSDSLIVFGFTKYQDGIL